MEGRLPKNFWLERFMLWKKCVKVGDLAIEWRTLEYRDNLIWEVICMVGIGILDKGGSSPQLKGEMSPWLRGVRDQIGTF